MNFDRYLRLFSTLLVLLGFTAILITGSYMIAVSIGIGFTLIDYFLGGNLATHSKVPRVVWNLVALALLLYLFVDTFFGEQDLVGNGIKFVVYLQIVKILSPKTNRDHLQIYLLSFLHVLASTVISSDVSFALPFLAYLVLSTWTLTLFTLKCQQEEAAESIRREALLRSLLRSTDVITPRFLFGTSSLALSIIAFTMVVFFLFPRLSLGQFFKQISRRQHMSGFSDQVELGTIGSIKTNDSVSFRVELTPEVMKRIDPERLYWRGSAADSFDGRLWSKNITDREIVRIDLENGVLATDPGQEPAGEKISYRVFLEPMTTPILFGADRLMQITWEKPMIERFFRGALALQRDAYGGIYFLAANNFVSDLTYVAESVLESEDSASLAKSEDHYPWYIRTYFLGVPEWRPEVRTVLSVMASPGLSPYSRAAAIQRYIETHYGYTLDVQDAGVEDPLQFFLVDRKKGHCEYFSTALAMALRFHGIPSRQVMGFRGGEINPYGNYVAVRQSDAHTWVEAYFSKGGWTRLDPSPLDTTVRAKPSPFRKLVQFTDYLRQRWNKYILEYDLEAQATIVEKIGRSLSSALRQTESSASTPGVERDARDVRQMFGKLLRSRWIVALFFLAALGALWRTWRAPRTRRSNRRYEELHALLQRQGYPRSPEQTLTEWRDRIERKEGPLPALRTLILLYEGERFGRQEVLDRQWRDELAKLKTRKAA